jgi:hypothetical protein
VPCPGVVVERFIEVIYTFTAVEIAKNGEKTVGFVDVLVYKSPKTSFFALKYLTLFYTPRVCREPWLA